MALRIARLGIMLALGVVGGASGTSPMAARIERPAPTRSEVPLLTASVVARFPHDEGAFTQGLLWHNDALYESTGRKGRSDIRRVRLTDGRVLARAAIPPGQFGEGLAAWRDELISLTWRDGIAHRWDRRTLKLRGRNIYPGEGWGLTSSASDLVLSDGTATLRFLDPVTFRERRRVTAMLPNGRTVDQLNELEWVDGAIFANVWHTGLLLRIDPADGRVTAIVDLRPLLALVAVSDPEAVLNGIAWDPKKRRMFVTGKLWPTLFEIRLDDRAVR